MTIWDCRFSIIFILFFVYALTVYLLNETGRQGEY